MKSLPFVTVIWLALMQVSVAYGQNNMVEIDRNVNSYEVDNAEYMLVLEDYLPEEIASLPAEQWHPEQYPSLQALDTKAQHWFRFDVNYHDNEPKNTWVIVGWPILDHVQMHIYDYGSGEWTSLRAQGRRYPIAQRYLKNRNFIFPLHLEKDQHKTIYISVRSNNLVAVPINIWDRSDYLEESQSDLILLGIFFGCLIIMFFYNLCLYFSIRDKSFFYYCVYIGAAILFQLSYTGLGAHYLWDDFTWLKQNSFNVFSNYTFLTAVLFVRHFLSLESYGGRLKLTNDALIIYWVIVSIVSLFDSGVWVRMGMVVGSIITCTVGLLMSIYLWNTDRYKYRARIYLYASLVISVGVMVFGLAIIGTLPLNIFTRYSQMLGFVVEFSLLSLALAHIINTEKKKAISAQEEALILARRVSEERRERLRAQMETLEVQQGLNQDLESHVNERTEQLKDAMKKLELANVELTKLSVTDSLSKVHNRRHFDDTLISEYKRAHRTGQSLAVILADVDYFKNINDHYGHTVGDECIELIAETLNKLVRRPGDMFARYGGEEFVYVLPGSDEASALTLANAARLAVEKIHFMRGNELIPLTISSGVAAWVPTVENAYKELLNGADAALYQAKEAGRNCVMTSQESNSITKRK